MKLDEVKIGQRVRWECGELGTVIEVDEDWVTVRFDAEGKIPSTVEEVDAGELEAVT